MYVFAKEDEEPQIYLWCFPNAFIISVCASANHIEIGHLENESQVFIWNGMKNVVNSCTFGMGVTYLMTFVFYSRIENTRTATLLAKLTGLILKIPYVGTLLTTCNVEFCEKEICEFKNIG